MMNLGEVTDAVQQFANGMSDITSNPLDGTVGLLGVGITVFNAISGNPLYGQVLGAGINFVALDQEMNKLLLEINKPTNQVDDHKLGDAVVGVIGAVGGIMATLLIPNIRAAGIAISLIAATAKEAQSGNIGGKINELLNWFDQFTWPPISDEINDLFTLALRWTPPPDPLVLDLDGDGIETVGLNGANSVLFDMDADGSRSATGWIKADDGLLVRDLNGNGTIDSGRELFGDATLSPSGQRATNGFQALGYFDSNKDSQITAADSVFGQLRIWQDANQDGISQAGELKTLVQAGIASISLRSTVSNTDLGNGNTQVLAGHFMRSNGATRNAGAAALTA